MSIIYQSKHFRPEAVLSTYALLYSTGEVKLFDVDKRHKTVREHWKMADQLSEDVRAKLRLGDQVLISGLTMQERDQL